jgi:hypothetical protein
MKLRPWSLVWLSLTVAACASAPSQPLPVGTLTLAQVAHVATKDEMARGVKVDDTSLLVPPYLLKRCALEAGSLESGDLAVMRVYVSWTSHVPQSSLWWVVVPKGMVVTPGDFVEVELKSGVGNERCPSIARVRSLSTASGECGYERNERMGVGAALESFDDTLHAIRGAEGGSPGSASIYCKGLEQESWMKEPAGPYDAIVWRRVPGVGYVAGPDSRIQRNGFSLLPPSGRGWAVAPTGQYGAGWGKLLSDSKGNRSTVTVLASAGRYKERKVDLTTPAGLRATAEYTVNGDGSSARYRVVESKYSDVYQKHGTDCIDFDYTAEDRGNTMSWNAGSVLVLAIHGTICRHPSNPEWSVNTVFSDRHPKDSLSLVDDTVREEVEHCLDSVQLTPLK